MGVERHRAGVSLKFHIPAIELHTLGSQNRRVHPLINFQEMGERWPLVLDFSNVLCVLLNRQQARRTLLLETMDVETRLLSDVE